MRNSLRAAALGLGLLASTLVVPSVADAQSASVPSLTLETVDAYRVGYLASAPLMRALVVTGVTAEQPTPVRFTLIPDRDIDLEACERAVIQVLNRPGRLRLEVMGIRNGTAVQPVNCQVVRVP